LSNAAYPGVSVLESTDPMPFRVHFELFQGDDYECKNEGDFVDWGGDKGVCIKEDIVNNTTKSIFDSILNSVSDFFLELVKVNREPNIYVLPEYSKWFIPSKNVSKEFDLYIIVTMRPMSDEDVKIVSSPIALSMLNNRPVYGLININPRFLNQISTNQVTVLSQMMFHEVVHVMGFINRMYKYWLNRQNNDPYGESLPLYVYYSENYPTKPHFILSTPKCHQYASKVFDSKLLSETIPIGIEIEDINSTNISHPSSRMFFGELMTNSQSYPSVLSNLTLSIIEDMGWYYPNYSMAEPLLWIDTSIYGYSNNISSFSLPPYLLYPKNYICSSNETKKGISCSYDFSSPASCPLIENTCDNNETENEFCMNQPYYNPYNYTYQGERLFDYLPLKLSDSRFLCSDDSITNYGYNQNFTAKFGMEFGSSSSCLNFEYYNNENSINEYSGCFKTKCSHDNRSIEFFIFSNTYTCFQENQRIEISNNYGIKSIICPDPLLFCHYRSSLSDIPRTTIPQETESFVTLMTSYLSGDLNYADSDLASALYASLSIVFIVTGSVYLSKVYCKNEETTFEADDNEHNFG